MPRPSVWASNFSPLGSVFGCFFFGVQISDPWKIQVCVSNITKPKVSNAQVFGVSGGETIFLGGGCKHTYIYMLLPADQRTRTTLNHWKTRSDLKNTLRKRVRP